MHGFTSMLLCRMWSANNKNTIALVGNREGSTDDKEIEQVNPECIYSDDIEKNLRGICRGLFGFMDAIVRTAATRNAGLDLSNGVYPPTGIIIVPDAGEYLASMIPALRYLTPSEGTPADHSSPA